MKVHIYPSVDLTVPDPGNGGIERVVRGQHAALPALGVELVDDPEQADLIHCHVEIPEAYLRRFPRTPIVTTCHGAYWTDGGYDWGDWAYAVNQKVLAAVRASTAMVGVSDWVSQSLRRASMRPVTTIYHGIDLADWPMTPPEEVGGYVLWNKTRVDPVCDVSPLNALAQLMPRQAFVSTFGDQRPNVMLVGRQTHAEAADLVRRAGVYLATTRETFGIGTLEAMACGVPVVGYDWGGQHEFIEHGVDGWLARPGDVEGLAEGIQWALRMRATIAPLARAKAEQFTIESTARDYRNLYADVLRQQRGAPRTSVIVPAYEMGDYLEAALASVAAQDDPDWECIVVNDASPDPRDAAIAQSFAARDERFRTLQLTENGYLANARNAGIDLARGRYILPLDADDVLTPSAVRTLADALDADRTIHITYGGVRFVMEDGATPVRYAQAHQRGLPDGQSGWPVPFRIDWMLDRPGQLLPYSSMFRREVWEHSGGYRVRSRSSEDQDFWLRATSYGYVPRMVTTADLLVYRTRADSMSATKGWEEHRPWFPWVAKRELLPAAAFAPETPERDRLFPALDPAPVAVIIPVGPGHEQLVLDAVDSVDAQTFRNWECFVVNDTGYPLPLLPSWVRVIEPACPACEGVGDVPLGPGIPCEDCDGTGLTRYFGVAAARNAGIAAADSSPLFIPLDADDYLQPEALEIMLEAYIASKEPVVVYCDFWQDPEAEGKFNHYRCPDYDPTLLTKRGLLHAVTCLTPRSFWEEVGGYKSDVAWEDWDFALAIADKGHCSRRVAAPLFTYRKHSGMRRNDNDRDFEESRRSIMAHGYWNNGGDLLACRRCPGGAATTMQMRQPLTAASGEPPKDSVFVRYVGSNAGATNYRGRSSGLNYRFGGSRPQGWILEADRQYFDESQDFEIQQPIAAAATLSMDEPTLVAERTPALVGAVDAPAGTTSAGVTDAIPMQAPPAASAPVITSTGPVAVAEVVPVVAEAPVAPPATAPVASSVTTEPVQVVGTTSAPVEAEGTTTNPQVAKLVHDHSRAELNKMATDLGLTGVAEMASKADVATAIFVKRQMG